MDNSLCNSLFYSMKRHLTDDLWNEIPLVAQNQFEKLFGFIMTLISIDDHEILENLGYI